MAKQEQEQDWIVVPCSGGCTKVTRVPPSDPLAKGWTCAACQYDNPTFKLDDPPKTKGGPKMSDAPSVKEPHSKDQSNLCRCGCGSKVRSNYAQGHDSRHISKMVAEVLAGKRTRLSAIRQFDFAPLMKQKFTKILERAEAKQAAEGK